MVKIMGNAVLIAASTMRLSAGLTMKLSRRTSSVALAMMSPVFCLS